MTVFGSRRDFHFNLGPEAPGQDNILLHVQHGVLPGHRHCPQERLHSVPEAIHAPFRLGEMPADVGDEFLPFRDSPGDNPGHGRQRPGR